MTLLIIDLFAIGATMLASIVLIILREKNGTRFILVAIFFEALFSMIAKLMLEPGAFPVSYLVFKGMGRVGEALTMWGVITLQLKGLLNVTNVGQLERIEAQLAEIRKHFHKGDPDATTH